MGRMLLSSVALLTIVAAATLHRTAAHAGSAPHYRMRSVLPQASSAFLPARASGRPARSTHQVQRLAHGVKLSLAVARVSYPINALIRATLTVKNVSDHQILLLDGGPQQPGKTFPQVEVLNAAGTVLPSSLLQGYLPPPGPAPTVRRLASGGGGDEHRLPHPQWSETP